MPSCVKNPRRAPRVRVKIPVDLAWGSASWPATMVDVSQTGCAVLTDRPLPAGAHVAIRVRRDAPVAPLVVEADVVWCRGMRFAATFSRVLGNGDVAAWMAQLQQAHASVRGAADRLPPEIPTDARLTVRKDLPTGGAVGADEARIVQAAWGGCAVGIAALHARLPPDRFARALYALLGKGIVSCPALEARGALAVPSLDDRAKALLRPGSSPVAGSRRGGLRDDLAAAELADEAKGR
jgi:hypothetical protein